MIWPYDFDDWLTHEVMTSMVVLTWTYDFHIGSHMFWWRQSWSTYDIRQPWSIHDMLLWITCCYTYCLMNSLLFHTDYELKASMLVFSWAYDFNAGPHMTYHTNAGWLKNLWCLCWSMHALKLWILYRTTHDRMSSVIVRTWRSDFLLVYT